MKGTIKIKTLVYVFGVGIVSCFLGMDVLSSSLGNEVITESEFRKTDAGTVRIIKPLPYPDAMKKADFVVIASAYKTEDTKDKPSRGEDYLLGQNTKFQILLVLKGDKKTKDFTLLHFRKKQGKRIGGMMLVKFELQKKEHIDNLINFSDRYILFLKRRKDGRYEPISEIFDTALSIEKISSAE